MPRRVGARRINAKTSSRSFRRTLPGEVHKFRVHFVRMRPIYGVRPIFYGGQASARDQLGGLFARGFDRYHAVGVAVNDQCGYVYTGNVLAEVLISRGDASETRRGRDAGGYVPTGFDDLFADALAEEDIERALHQNLATRRGSYAGADYSAAEQLRRCQFPKETSK